MRLLHLVHSELNINCNLDSLLADTIPPTLSLVTNIQLPLNELYLWSLAIEASVYVLIDPVLNIDETSVNKQSVLRANYVRENFDDSRETICKLLIEIWGRLGNSARATLLVQMLPLALILIGSSSKMVQDVGIVIFFDLLRAELSISDCLTSCTSSLLLSTTLILQARGNVSEETECVVAFEKDIFIEFASHKVFTLIKSDDNLNIPVVQALFEDLSYFVRLQEAFSFYAERELYEDEMHEVALQMIGFSFERGMTEQYYRTVHSMALEYCTQMKFVEASYLLTSHADMLPSDSSFQEELLFGFRRTERLGAMASWERKVFLIETAVDLCDRDESQDWERCVILLDQLIKEYRARNMSKKVKSLLNRQIQIHDKIATTSRVTSSMFLVGYYGAFREELRNCEIVYRGKKAETVVEFKDSLTQKYPGVVILKPTDTVHDDHRNSEDLFIQIMKVQPFHTTDNPCTAFCQSDMFSYSSPIRRNSVVSNEFLDIWIKRRIVTVTSPMPTITDRLEVIPDKTRIVTLNPIEVAIDALSIRTSSLERGITDMEHRADSTPQHVTMEISGTVDAVVNGGLKNYISILNGEYKTINAAIDEDIAASPAKAEVVDQFKKVFRQHLDVVSRAVGLHKLKCHESMQPLQRHLENALKVLVERVGESISF